MSFLQLALVCAAGLLGPLLATPRRWFAPVVLGELAAGMVLGATGLGWLDAADPTFTFLGQMGFALVMFVVGTHVPLGDPRIRPALRRGTVRAILVGLAALPLAGLIARLVHVPHAALYAVLLASSSAAVALPVIDGSRADDVLDLIPQVAVADAVCIVLLPLAVDPPHAGRVALGSLAVLAAAALVWVVLREVERRGWRHRVHEVSEDRAFAAELRVSLTLLFLLAALAVGLHVSLVLAGFALGLAVAAVGEPRRVATQLFAVSEGFLAPIFFVWLGASLQFRDVVAHPHMALLGLALGLGAVLAHLVPTGRGGQPTAYALLAAAQLGVPVAAATLGGQLGVLEPGEGAAFIVGAVVTLGGVLVGARLLARDGHGLPAVGASG